MKIKVGRHYFTAFLGKECLNMFLLKKQWNYGRGLVIELWSGDNTKVYTIPRNVFARASV